MLRLGTILLIGAVALIGSSEASNGLLRRLRRQNTGFVDSLENNVASGEWVNPSSGSRLNDANAFASNLENQRNRLTQDGRSPVSWNDRIDRARQQNNDDFPNGNGASNSIRPSNGASRTNGNGRGTNNGQYRANNYNNNNNRGRYDDSYGNTDYANAPRTNNGYRNSNANPATNAGTGTGISGADQSSSGFTIGGGLFGGGRSLIGGFISGIGQGISNAVQGVSRALANKWDTKVAAFRGIASNSIRAGLSHPRFAFEALQNVFG